MAATAALVGMLLALTGTAQAFPSTASAPAAKPSAPASPAKGSAHQRPCDIYASGGTPCAAAHSTTRALYASYDGPLYKVVRLSDGRLKNIGVVKPTHSRSRDAGGYADAAAQDAFCANTTCLITTIYDQSPNHNDLTRAPRGNFSGPAMGGANNLPIADAAPITINGHKAYGVFIEPGMGLRNNDTKGIAVDDQAEGMYWVINGQHHNDGCCFDYGNTEIDSRDDGNGTMETSYFGDSTGWYHGQAPGPWIMTDQENNLLGCVNPGSTSKYCADLPTVSDRFVTAVAKGKPHHWATLGGNAQQGALATMFDGPRVDSSYDPMRKQGGIVLGNGGDNSNGSQGTFYEGVMTAGYPSNATDQKVQANVVAANYAEQQLSLAPASATDTPPGLQTFAPGSNQDVTETFTNTTGSRAVGVKLSLTLPSHRWTAVVKGTHSTSKAFSSLAPGASVSATFRVTSGPEPFDGDLIGNAAWTNPTKGGRRAETTTEKVRNVDPIKINEFQIGTSSDPTDSFIELVNTSDRTVDLSHWALTEHPIAQAVFSTITIPAGTKLAGGGHYLLGLAASGLAAPANKGDTSVNLRSTTGLTRGEQVQIGTGAAAETRTISAITNSGATGPRVPGKIGNAVKLSGNGEYVALPDGIVSGLNDFTISAWVNPAADSTWSRIFDFGNSTSAYMFMSVNGGGSGLRFAITNSGNGAEQQLTGGGQLPLNTWSYVAVTLSGTTGRLYLNGNLVATNTNMTLNPSSLGSTSNNWIGRSQFPDPDLNATVDDFQIYDHALSGAEIGTLVSGQPGAGNVASYAFDENSGATALDSSGNGRNATIVSDATEATAGTPLWQPLPDGPITVPARSTNVPVTSTSGFVVGQKLAIGYGDKMDIATVTAVGTPGTQARLAADAPTGATNLKVSSTANITAGDTIRLDIGSRMETVTVASVGTPGARGTGLDLTAPLKFGHSSNLPFSDRGTGVTFSPATRFAHVSNEPVRALGSGITLDKPLHHSYGMDAPVVDTAVTTAGYQGTPAPDQWFGGPALSSGGGSMVVSNPHGVAADSLNFGRLVDPWLAEGYQGTSGPGQSGCTVAVPATGRSAARYPDGTDTDSNCSDFMVTSKPTPGATNQGIAGSYNTVTSKRLLDTRAGLGAPKHTVAKGATLTFNPTTGITGPVSAVVLNVTAVNPTAIGYLTVYPAGGARPLASNLNYQPHQTVPNMVVVKTGADGAVSIFNGSEGTIDILANIEGYVSGGAAATEAGTMVPTTPTRVLDTRIGSGGPKVKIPAYTQATVNIAGLRGIPADAAAVALNLTAVTPAARGYLTAYPGTPTPMASTLNFEVPQTRANLTLVQVNQGGPETGTPKGTISIYNGSAKPIDVVADVDGYFLAGTPAADGSFVTSTPFRVFDSRTQGGRPAGALTTSKIQIFPNDPTFFLFKAVQVNVVAARPTAAGFLTTWDGSIPQPSVSSSNFVPGANVAGSVIVPVNSDGTISIYNGSYGTVDLVVDVNGFFLNDLNNLPAAARHTAVAKALSKMKKLGTRSTPMSITKTTR